ncbi:putative AbiEii toxin of type IV toxin-antitoxin system [Rhodopseudomonas thermotolerans]|uniref:AbiEii toxin of type IV toxin-antitoxin system n=2 Tax=Rhodopseudomonas TaxID=1073 RepID=A0A336JTL9_9BRAD|nr:MULTISPECIES: AAA family ATPase [Rhodopseudomonas]RED25543.1 putative AbiEii toxin of type IV toxin-antitoxin system [Rhodopseudomonas pentothenatexigens]REF90373.1 putative AbiEii toxin of type IV toxin-antitoxin system [Rhodopseudomonas thermotolerans]SSW93155.1 putative AbiEii toxin of type IV toxin-antitoxin system [Rhodopseudomonas pentothenatexigens]
MRFRRVENFPGTSAHKGTCYLVNDNWDDFSFKTSFDSILLDAAGDRRDLGGVKILKRGMTGGRVPLDDRFSQLDDDWCSLGTSREYYIALSKLDEALRTEYLIAIRDCVANKDIWHSFRDEEGMKTSLLRSVSIRDVETNFPRILNGDTALTPYNFEFEFEAGANDAKETCRFSVEPGSKPPTNVHVIIGRNGVGKTRLLAGMADALSNNRAASIGLRGEFTFLDSDDEENEFLNLVVVSYSAFDRFNPLFRSKRESKESIPYYYVGIKKRKETPELGDSAEDRIELKTASDFDDEFGACLRNITGGGSTRAQQKMAQWRRALSVLQSDPGLNEFIEGAFGASFDGAGQLEDFTSLSSGHKIVLLTIAKLVDVVSDRSFVLIDEPETHLHPPLLGSFIRAISELLISQNAVAVVATHSPVVLQEVPKSCVSVISRSGSRIRVRRPSQETFAENVSVLTRKIFGLEVHESGFYRLLNDASQGREFEVVISEFKDQVGAEGRALARAFTIKEDDE